MKLLIYLLSTFCLTQTFSQKKQVCFSLDDLPLVTYGLNDTVYQKGLMDRLILCLNKNKIPAIGFVNEVKLFNDNMVVPFQVGLLNQWVNSGLELGNHTYSHPDYNTLSFKEFTQDVLKGEILTRQVLQLKGKSLKYFRHPFLHIGNSKVKSDSLNIFLYDHGYAVAPVTIDNEDYIFALAYKRAADNNDSTLRKKIGSDYIDYTEKKLKQYEKQTDLLFGRQVKHVLLLHANLLNSDYMDSLAKLFRENNYEFVTMEKALKDKAYKTDITVYGNWGISWIERWALSQGKKGDFFKGEPIIPDYIRK